MSRVTEGKVEELAKEIYLRVVNASNFGSFDKDHQIETAFQHAEDFYNFAANRRNTVGSVKNG